MSLSLTDVYAGRRMDFLIDAKPALYVELEQKGELKAHLLEIGRQAEERYQTLKTQMLAEGKIPAEQIPLIAEEIVLNDIVFA